MTRLKGKARDKAKKKQKNKDKNSYFLRKKKLLSKIRKWDDPILKETCSPVDPSEDISEIVKEMKSILMLSDNGLGLAASQIGIDKRIFVTRPRVDSGNITVFVNATITSESKEREKRGEGCLSYPGIVAVIERPAEIVIAYEDEKFKEHEDRLKGLAACVACHEHDHTLGVCLVGDAYRKSEEEKEENGSILEEATEVISEDVEQQV
jgi:peptide deformylase